MVSLWFPNQVVDDLYEVRDLITSGNMGRVYQVRHRQWGIDLAVKVPKTGIVHSPEIRRQFEDEAQAWVDLGLHPHVVNCVYVRRLDDLPHVFAEWMDGGDLAKGIEDQRIYEQGIAGLLDIAIQCAWGLAHAHDHGLVHQDVKPGNIMLSGDGSVKITDFGIARAYEAAGQGNSGRTGRFAWAGKTVTYRGMTPAYCSPQQAQAAKRNKDKIRLTTATDVWSWGLTVLAMFAGGQPSNHGEKAAEALETVRSRPAGQRIPPLPEELADLLSRCFAHDPTRRPEKMLDLADELTVLFESLTGESYVRRPPSAARLLADELSNRALSMMDLGRPAKAAELWTTALKADPHHLHSVYNYGLHRWRTGQATGTDLITALKETPDSNENGWLRKYLLGLAQAERGERDESIRLLAEAVVQSDRAPEVVAARSLAEASQTAPSPGTWAPWSYAKPTSAAIRQAAADNVALALARAAALERAGRPDEVETELYAALRLPGYERNEELLGMLRLISRRDRDLHPGRRTGLREAWEERRFPVGHVPHHPHDVYAGTRRQFSIGPLGTYSLTRDGHLLLSGPDLWDLRTGEPRYRFSARGPALRGAAISPDGAIVAAGCEDATVRLWDAGTGEPRKALHGHSGEVDAVAFGADGRLLVSGARDGSVRVWDVVRGTCLYVLEKHRDFAVEVAITDDARFVLARGFGTAVSAWELSTGRYIEELAGDPHHVTSSMASIDSSVYLAPGFALGFHLTDLRAVRSSSTGKPLFRTLFREQRHLSRHGNRPEIWVAVSSDGRIAHSAHADGTIRVWDLRAARSLRTLNAHFGPVRMLAPFPDGRFTVSGGADGRVLVWDLETGHCLRVLATHRSEVAWVGASADSGTVVSIGRDGNAQVWRLVWDHESSGADSGKET